jgi:mRNA-degrading endonuclease RelE of RelBE toxin-antitoxin system
VKRWALKLKPSARRELRQLEGGPRQRAVDFFEELIAEGPAIAGAIELRSNPDIWRVRFHEAYRMVYQVFEGREISL